MVTFHSKKKTKQMRVTFSSYMSNFYNRPSQYIIPGSTPVSLWAQYIISCRTVLVPGCSGRLAFLEGCRGNPCSTAGSKHRLHGSGILLHRDGHYCCQENKHRTSTGQEQLRRLGRSAAGLRSRQVAGQIRRSAPPGLRLLLAAASSSRK